MPLTDDQKALAFATLVPGAAVLVGIGAYKSDPTIMEWYKGLKKPSWVFSGEDDSIYWKKAIVNLVTMSPAVYATYLMHKKGAENADVRCALTGYAALWGGMALATPLFYQRNLKLNTALCTALFGVCACVARKYHEIDKHTGQLMLPMTALFGFASIAYYHIWQMNKEPEKTE